MYAFTLKKRQIPIPTSKREKTVNTVSSPRNLHRKNLCNKVFTATEKIAAIKNKAAAKIIFWESGFKVKLPPKEKGYAVNGAASTNTAKAKVNANKGKRGLLCDLLHFFRKANPKISRTACKR